MSNYKFSGDILDDILQRAGETTDSTSDFYADAIRYMNRAYQSIYSGGSELDPTVDEAWWWLRKSSPGVLTLRPKKVGTATMTQDSDVVTLAAAVAVSMVGEFFKVDSFADVFRVKTHTAATTAVVLDSPYTGTAGAGQAWTSRIMEYTLATDVLRVIGPIRTYQNSEDTVKGVELNELERVYPLTLLNDSQPRLFAMVGEQKVRFSHSVTALTRGDYDYLFKPADLTDSGTEEPLVPESYRRIIADTALFFLHMDKNDNRASNTGLLAKNGLTAMGRENRRRLVRFGGHYGKVVPRAGVGQSQDPVRTQSGLIIG